MLCSIFLLVYCHYISVLQARRKMGSVNFSQINGGISISKVMPNFGAVPNVLSRRFIFYFSFNFLLYFLCLISFFFFLSECLSPNLETIDLYHSSYPHRQHPHQVSGKMFNQCSYQSIYWFINTDYLIISLFIDLLTLITSLIPLKSWIFSC